MQINGTNNLNISTKPATTQKDNASQRRVARVGISVAAAGIGTGFTVLALTKGFSKGGRNNINKFYKFISEKAEQLSKNPVNTKFEKFTKASVDTTKSVLESTRGFFNTISLKDIIFKKVTDPIPVLGKACAKTTEFFEKVAVDTTVGAYSKTSKKFDKMYSTLSKANEKLSKEASQKAKKNISSIKRVFDKNFGVGEINTRIGKTKDIFKDLDERFWNRSFKDLKSLATDKDTYSSFIAEKMLAGDKSKILSEINIKKAQIQFSQKDDYKNMKTLFDDIKGLIDPFKKGTPLESIKSHLEAYKKSGSNDVRAKIIEEMKTLTTFVEDKKIAKQMSDSINALPKNSQGKLQDLLSIYKKELSPKEYAKLENTVASAMKSLENSTNLETDCLFDKLRDLKIGSAPTDMVTLITTFAAVAIGLGQAKNDDERASAALKYGIPAIGTVATSMLCTLKMMTAAPSLIFGAISGLIINQIGVWADDMRKAHSQTKQNVEA